MSITETETDPVGKALATPGAFIYHHLESDQIAIFSKRSGAAMPVRSLAPSELNNLLARNAVCETTRTDRGVRYQLPLPEKKRKSAARQAAPAKTAAQTHAPAGMKAERFVQIEGSKEPQRISVNMGESPLGWLARRKNAKGQPFLTAEHLAAGERLREDFEHAQMGPRVTQDWKRFLCAGVEESRRSDTARAAISDSAEAAKHRVMNALNDLGPDLSDAVFRTCCFLEGLETIERDLNWSARSGKIVLRIALQRLVQHYEALDNPRAKAS